MPADNQKSNADCQHQILSCIDEQLVTILNPAYEPFFRKLLLNIHLVKTTSKSLNCLLICLCNYLCFFFEFSFYFTWNLFLFNKSKMWYQIKPLLSRSKKNFFDPVYTITDFIPGHAQQSLPYISTCLSDSPLDTVVLASHCPAEHWKPLPFCTYLQFLSGFPEYKHNKWSDEIHSPCYN